MKKRTLIRFSTRAVVAVALVAGAAVLLSSPSGPYTANDKAYYLSPAAADMIRPGLVIKVAGVEVATDGTVKVRVKITDPKGVALDRDGIQTPGSVSTSFILARIPKGETQYVSYTTRTQTSPITGKSAVQAGADSGGTWAKNADGDYTYTMATKLPSSYDKTVTHTIGAYGSRNITEFGLGTQYSNDVYNWVPDGSPVKNVRDVIRTATCNKCHYSMGFHGGSRRTMELCVLCHTPQTIDPDTGNSVDMPVMTHRIHAGSKLPSVIAGKKYIIIGNAQSVNDYSGISFPADVRNCSVCHEKGAAQAENVYKANMAACGACHDDVEFNTGKNHVNLPQYSNNLCTTCHIPKGELEFDASIVGAHTIPNHATALPGVVFNIIQVANGAPGKYPTIVFSIKDKNGKPVPPSALSSLTVSLYGPNTDVRTVVREAALKADTGADGMAWWTFNTPIPANATGSWSVAIEGRRDVTLLPGTAKQVAARDIGINKQMAFAVDNSKATPRRTIVTTEKCFACHQNFDTFHGGSRNTVAQCVLCHNANGVVSATQTSYNLPLFIHKIHMGDELTRPYAVGTWSPNKFGYPGRRAACDACHVNGSENPPLPAGVGNVTDGSAFINPTPPLQSACLACHDTKTAASHALSNTNALGENCASCHGAGGDFSVAKVHAQ